MRKWVVAAVIGVVSLTVLPATVAGAASYPPATTTSSGAPGSASTSVTIPVGGTSNQQTCSFASFAQVTISINGTVVTTVTADSSGCITFSISVTDPHISINGGTAVAVNYGLNKVTATGPGNNGGTFTYTVSVNIPASTGSGSGSGAGSGSSGSGSSGAGSSGAGSSGAGSSGSSGSGSTATTGLAFTGADIAAMVAGGLVLLGLGVLLVVFTRRRAGRHRSA